MKDGLCLLVAAVFIMPLPSGREAEGAEVEWGEKEGQEGLEKSVVIVSCNIALKKCLDKKNTVGRKELWSTETLLKILHSLSVLDSPDFKR